MAKKNFRVTAPLTIIPIIVIIAVGSFLIYAISQKDKPVEPIALSNTVIQDTTTTVPDEVSEDLDTPTTSDESTPSDETAKDQKWISFEPIQCLGNPWEQDWLNKNNRDYDSYPKKTDTQIIKNFIEAKGYQVYSINQIDEHKLVCKACSCPRGDTIKVLINSSDESTVINLLK